MRHRSGIAAMTVAAALSAGGCSGPAAAGEQLDVVVSFSALEFVAGRIAGGDAQVTNLTPPGADPHSLELSAARVAELQQADLVVYLSGLQPAIDDAVELLAGVPVVDTLEAASADVSGAAETSTDTPDGAIDPHYWLDPMRLAHAGRQVAAALADIDPDRAARYEERSAALDRDLADLDRDFAAALAPCRGATLVTSHEAFGYLAARYGLNQVGIAGVDPGIEPSPARLREVSGIVADSGVRTVFFDVNASQKVTELLADELGVETGLLDPMERPRDADYLTVMRDNLDALTRGLACAG